jgi:hypothetical protein
VRRAAVLALAATVVLGAAACESTQEKSARLAKRARTVLRNQHGVVVTRPTRDVAVGPATVLRGGSGTAAAVVELRNRTARTLVDLPISITVKGTGDKVVFRNDAPGLEPALAHVAVLPPHGRLLWVNDQVQASAAPRAVAARVGAGPRSTPSAIPRIALTRPALGVDEVDGTLATGWATNRSAVLQRRLVIFAVARRGARVVAAGRGLIPRLAPGKRARYRIFFVGDPRGARLTLAAPPTAFPGGGS